MDLSTRRLRYALEVDRRRSFTAAAEALHLTQQGLSQQVRALERGLGFALFARTTRNVTTTVAGRAYLDRAQQAVRELEAARSAALELVQPTTRLVLGTLPGAAAELTDHLIARLRDAVPAIELELCETPLDDPTAGLTAGRADFAILRAPLDTTGLKLYELFAEPRVVALPAGHALAGRDTVEPADLRAFAVLGLRSPDAIFNGFWTLDDVLGSGALRVTGTTASITQELQTVASGEAISITASAAERLLPFPGVVFRPLANCPPSRVCLAHRADDDRPVVLLAVAACLEAAKERAGTLATLLTIHPVSKPVGKP
ncbi:LysR family transcriptional regulator [Mycobacterium sp. ML4]